MEMRKNIGQPFLGPDKLPLVIQGIVMCGDRPEWKDKVGAWSMDDYHLAPKRREMGLQNSESWGTGRGVDRKRYEIRNDGLKGVFTLRFRKLTPRKA